MRTTGEWLKLSENYVYRYACGEQEMYGVLDMIFKRPVNKRLEGFFGTANSYIECIKALSKCEDTSEEEKAMLIIQLNSNLIKVFDERGKMDCAQELAKDFTGMSAWEEADEYIYFAVHNYVEQWECKDKSIEGVF